jgi:alpha-tubulin suppressor-like RCC1 family protein
MAVDGSAVWAVDRSVTQGDERMSSMWRKQVAGALVSVSALAMVAPVEAQVVRAWGNNEYGQVNLPSDLGSVTQLGAGLFHSVALRADGTVRCWGRNDYGQCNVPTDLGSVARITVGGHHAVAVRSDGSIRCWGLNDFGQCNTPVDLGTVSSAAGGA